MEERPGQLPGHVCPDERVCTAEDFHQSEGMLLGTLEAYGQSLS